MPVALLHGSREGEADPGSAGAQSALALELRVVPIDVQIERSPDPGAQVSVAPREAARDERRARTGRRRGAWPGCSHQARRRGEPKDDETRALEAAWHETCETMKAGAHGGKSNRSLCAALQHR